ncbi:MAG: STAS domain-containing protein [Candidatus Omnitrophica bacterium]|nr:STAS domain-containing protein [Candidatus Omnitrophota bacterium]
MMDAPNRLELVKTIEGVKVYRMIGSYTVGSTADYYKVCSVAVSDPGTKAILLDFTGVSDMDTAGFACVINFIKENLREGMKVGVINVGRKVQDLAGILKITSAIRHYRTEEEAIKSLSRR